MSSSMPIRDEHKHTQCSDMVAKGEAEAVALLRAVARVRSLREGIDWQRVAEAVVASHGATGIRHWRRDACLQQRVKTQYDLLVAQYRLAVVSDGKETAMPRNAVLRELLEKALAVEDDAGAWRNAATVTSRVGDSTDAVLRSLNGATDEEEKDEVVSSEASRRSGEGAHTALSLPSTHCDRDTEELAQLQSGSALNLTSSSQALLRSLSPSSTPMIAMARPSSERKRQWDTSNTAPRRVAARVESEKAEDPARSNTHPCELPLIEAECRMSKVKAKDRQVGALDLSPSRIEDNKDVVVLQKNAATLFKAAYETAPTRSSVNSPAVGLPRAEWMETASIEDMERACAGADGLKFALSLLENTSPAKDQCFAPPPRATMRKESETAFEPSAVYAYQRLLTSNNSLIEVDGSDSMVEGETVRHDLMLLQNEQAQKTIENDRIREQVLSIDRRMTQMECNAKHYNDTLVKSSQTDKKIAVLEHQQRIMVARIQQLHDQLATEISDRLALQATADADREKQMTQQDDQCRLSKDVAKKARHECDGIMNRVDQFLHETEIMLKKKNSVCQSTLVDLVKRQESHDRALLRLQSRVEEDHRSYMTQYVTVLTALKAILKNHE